MSRRGCLSATGWLGGKPMTPTLTRAHAAGGERAAFPAELLQRAGLSLPEIWRPPARHPALPRDARRIWLRRNRRMPKRKRDQSARRMATCGRLPASARSSASRPSSTASSPIPCSDDARPDIQPGGGSRCRPKRPGDAQGRQPAGAAVVRKRVEERIGGGMNSPAPALQGARPRKRTRQRNRAEDPR